MKTRTFLVMVIVVAALVALVVVTHTAGGQTAPRSIRALHGAPD